MTTVSKKIIRWDQTESADAFVERADAYGLTTLEMRAVTQLADDDDEAATIADFIVALRQG
jgi:hypothetical protein